jgi:hypothetical protein
MKSRSMLVAALGVAAGALAPRPAHATLPLPADQIALDTPMGEKLLDEANARADYYKLSEHFVVQKNQGYCPVASGVMVLGALDVPAPEVKDWAGYRGFTQDNFFGDGAKKLGLARGGLTLDQFADVLRTHPLTVKAVHAADATESEFRRALTTNLADPRDYIVVNWLRSKIDQEPKDGLAGALAGHWSPVGAYHEASDRVLVLDVAGYKYPPFWVGVPRLFAAMRTVDADSGKSRGWLEIARSPDLAPQAPDAAPRSRFVLFVLGGAFAIFALGALAGSVVTRWRMQRAKAHQS